MTILRAPDDDADWKTLRADWEIRVDTIYLNHGSFGPPPRVVREARARWLAQLDQQPMDFYVRRLEPAWFAARAKLAAFIGTNADNLVFVENATAGMNVVADSFPLAAGDEVVLTDHEYGAVRRIWQRACDGSGAVLKTAELPLPFRSVDETVDAIFAAVTNRTRMLVVSHITSPTAVILPVQAICRRARQAGIAVAVDGPHAVAQIPLMTDELDCDFYAASCHKWLSAPFGAGYLYVASRHQATIRTPLLSWGRISPTPVESWSDEFVWPGTRDQTPYLAVPAAIEYLEGIGLEAFRARTHWLAQYARRKLVASTGLEPIVPDDPSWYGSMAHVPLPLPRGGTVDASTDRNAARSLQDAIWRELRTEVPIVEFRGRRYIRISCHLYNDTRQIDDLTDGLGRLLSAGI